MGEKNKGELSSSDSVVIAWIIIGAVIGLISLQLQYTGNVTRQVAESSSTTPIENITNETAPVQEQPSPIAPEIASTQTTQQQPQIQSQTQTCVVPYEDMVISTNTTLCTGTYYLNDANGNGVIRMGANNIVLDCNDSNIIGTDISNSIAIGVQYGGYTNLSIHNCKLNNYHVGISINNAIRWRVYNNNITSCYKGIDVDQYPYNDAKGYNNIYDNNLYDCNYSCINLQGEGHDNIYNNFINRSSTYGFWINRMNYSSFYNNTLYNTVDNTIRMNDDYTWFNRVYNNTVSNSGWNCIDVMGRFSNFTENNLNNCSHNALNANTDYDDRPYSSNNYIANNFVNNSGECMYIDGVANSTYFNNTCYGQHIRNIPGSLSIGVSSDGVYSPITGQISTHDNTILSNYFDGFDDYGIKDHSINSSNKYINNIFANTNKAIYAENYFGVGSDSSIVYFNNNTEIDGLTQYIFNVDKPQIYHIEDYNAKAYIKLNTNRRINVTYDGFHNLIILNQDVSFFNLSEPYNDVKNSSNGVILASNVNTFTTTLTPNQQIEVGDFVLDPIVYNSPRTPTISLVNLDNITLNCSAVITDSDSEKLNVTIIFLRNNSQIQSESFIDVNNNSISYSLFSNLSDNYVYKCNVSINDGHKIVSNVSSTYTYLINDPPIITTSLSQVNQSLVCNTTIIDPDSTNFNVSIEWFKNDIRISNLTASTTNTTLHYTLTNLNTNQNYSCIVNVSDINYTVSSTKSMIYLYNAAPNAPNVTVSRNNDVLNCSATITDPDSNTLNTTTTFYRNRILFSSAQNTIDNNTPLANTITIPVQDLDNWTCNVSVSDYNYTRTAASTLQILINDPPTVNISIYSPDNSTAYNLSCNITITDADSSLFNSTIEWYKNDDLEYTEQSTNSANSVTKSLSSTNLSIGDVWYCKATVTDGINNTIAISNTLTIEGHTNIAPKVSTSLSYANNTLSCAINSMDIDNSSLIANIDYYSDNSVNNTKMVTIPTGYYADNYTTSLEFNQSWYCLVTINDTINSSSDQSNIITIKDSTSPNIMLYEPNNGYSSTDSSVYFNYSATDQYHNTLECNLMINNLSQTIETQNNTMIILNKSLSIGTYYWNISCTDPDNNTAYSNNRAISIILASQPKPSSGGSGKGATISTSNNTNTSIKANTTSTNNNTKIVKNNSNKPTVETLKDVKQVIVPKNTKAINAPSKDIVGSAFKSTMDTLSVAINKNSNFYSIILSMFSIMIITLLITKKSIMTNESLNQYITKCLYSGYTYEAIRTSLRNKGWKDSVIDHHFYMLRLKDLRPIIRQKTPQTYKMDPEQKKFITQSLIQYVQRGETAGFEKQDIKQALLHYGHDKFIVEEVFQNSQII